jgi:phage/plasmid-like protein (TIGR03299 family)
MAHEIDMSVAGGSAAFAREPAWHGLGKVLPDVMTGAEAIQAAGLGWKVGKRQLLRHNNLGLIVQEKDTFAVVRDDTQATLGIVSNQYTPCQNDELSGFLDAVIGTGARIESAGALHGGRKVWFLCNLQESFEVVPGDEVKPYALFVNGHDGRTRLRVLPTTVRVVCANTLTVATNGETLGCTIVHNGKLTENVERARESLGLVHTAVERMKIEAKFLAAKQVRQDDLARFFVRQVEGMKFSKERAELVLQQIAIVSQDETNNLTGMRGSAWAAYNAFSEWVDHAQRRTGLDARVESIWMGEGARQKSRAWGQLLAL